MARTLTGTVTAKATMRARSMRATDFAMRGKVTLAQGHFKQRAGSRGNGSSSALTRFRLVHVMCVTRFGWAVHHAEHRGTAGPKEAPHQQRRQREERDVEPGRV